MTKEMKIKRFFKRERFESEMGLFDWICYYTFAMGMYLDIEDRIPTVKKYFKIWHPVTWMVFGYHALVFFKHGYPVRDLWDVYNMKWENPAPALRYQNAK